MARNSYPFGIGSPAGTIFPRTERPNSPQYPSSGRKAWMPPFKPANPPASTGGAPSWFKPPWGQSGAAQNSPRGPQMPGITPGQGYEGVTRKPGMPTWYQDMMRDPSTNRENIYPNPAEYGNKDEYKKALGDWQRKAGAVGAASRAGMQRPGGGSSMIQPSMPSMPPTQPGGSPGAPAMQLQAPPVPGGGQGGLQFESGASGGNQSAGGPEGLRAHPINQFSTMMGGNRVFMGPGVDPDEALENLRSVFPQSVARYEAQRSAQQQLRQGPPRLDQLHRPR